MPALEKRLSDYLESIAGSTPVLRDAPAQTQASLPLFLRERYRLCHIELFGRECLLALETPGWETGSPAEYAAHAQAMQAQFSEPVTLVIPQVASYARSRMVQAGMPFIVPGSQLFMPFMMVDLRERFTAPGPEAGLPVTPAAQCILLYHLLRKPLHGMPLQDIAKLTGYSGMMVTKVKDEWETNGLCQTARAGRSVVVEFTAGGRELWHRAEQLLSSPVKKSHWGRWNRPALPALAAGYTALSHTTMIDDDPVPTVALHRKDFRALFDNGTFLTVGEYEEANVVIQEWSYNPRLLSDGPYVDPLSLVLSLRGDSDDRVQQQLETVLDGAFSK
jgi:DNA-binding MarR family transcriptional regulator